MGMTKVRFRRPEPPTADARVHPVFDDFHLLRMDGAFEYPGHRHANYELILVERGPYRCTLNASELELANGQVVVIKPGDFHQDHLCDGQRHYVVHFRLSPGADGTNSVALFHSRVTPAQQVSRRGQGHDVVLIRELRREAQAGRPHAGAVQDCLLEALFWRTVRDLPPEGLSLAIRRLSKDEAMRERIAVVMRRQLHGRVETGALARELGISRRHLTDCCRALYGTSPARLFLQLKLREAAALLQGHDLRVKEVSDRLGFANPYHFSRVFRREFGQPPSRT
jgi:AraC-like DNA-binding protein